jgi:hypothetical protein
MMNLLHKPAQFEFFIPMKSRLNHHRSNQGRIVLEKDQSKSGISMLSGGDTTRELDY